MYACKLICNHVCLQSLDEFNKWQVTYQNFPTNLLLFMYFLYNLQSSFADQIFVLGGITRKDSISIHTYVRTVCTYT